MDCGPGEGAVGGEEGGDAREAEGYHLLVEGEGGGGGGMVVCGGVVWCGGLGDGAAWLLKGRGGERVLLEDGADFWRTAAGAGEMVLWSLVADCGRARKGDPCPDTK